MSTSLNLEQYLIEPHQGSASKTHLDVKVSSGLLGGDFSIMQGVMKPGDLLCPHTHEREDQCVYVIDGELEFELGGKEGLRFTARAGSYVVKPRGISHAFWNSTETPVPYIELSGQDGFERWVASHDQGTMKAVKNSKRDYAMEMHLDRIPEMLKTYNLKSLAGVDNPPALLKGAFGGLFAALARR